ncbi:MAG: hypothetical protein MJA84_08510 [Firmicutes bacterium]|nr:hypothetical protein [Bacillota bacterium]
MKNERIEFRSRPNKPRRELSLPQLAFHHADHWMEVLGLEVFAAWQMIYTWCDRDRFPYDDVSHHKNIKGIAKAFGCKSDKAQNIIKKLYEYGLVDIIQKKNKFGSMKNIYYWYEIPIYADSTFCELRKCRNWEDRNSHGQELAKSRNIKKKNSSLKSRTEKSYGSDNNQENSGFQDEPYEKTVHSNDLKYINAVVDHQEDKNSKQEKKAVASSGPELVMEPKTNDIGTVQKIQEVAKSKCNTSLPDGFATRLLKEYPPERIVEKIEMIGTITGQIRNLPGFLLSALRDNYVHIPVRASSQCDLHNSKKKTSRAGPGPGAHGKKYNGLDWFPSEERDEIKKKRRELLESLYMN